MLLYLHSFLQRVSLYRVHNVFRDESLEKHHETINTKLSEGIQTLQMVAGMVFKRVHDANVTIEEVVQIGHDMSKNLH